MNKLPENIFREYDIRGDAKKELNDSVVHAIAEGFATWLGERGVRKLALGGDARRSTPDIRGSLYYSLHRMGFEIFDLLMVPTPMLYWSLYHLDLDAGIMITGSHNPPEMNGLKLVYNKATLWGDEIQQVRKLAEIGGEPAKRVGTIFLRHIEKDYIDMLASKIKLKRGARKLRVAYDCGNGAAGWHFGDFLDRIGCEGFGIHEHPDGDFPNHHPDPQKRENLQDLIALVKEESADVGIAFDGDADRIGVVDERGEIIWCDRLMALYWGEILKKHPGAPVLVEVKCSMALVEEAEKMGGKPIFCQGGHSRLKAKMREIGAPFAGEYSGHMFFADEYFGFDDPFYAAGRLLRIMANNRGKTLSELMSHIPEYPSTQEKRLDCPDDKKFALIEGIKNKLERENKHELITCEGVRIAYPDGWGLVRASNTQPMITARCEGRTEKSLAKISAEVKKLIVAEGLPSFRWER